MQRHIGWAQARNGDAVPGATITVYQAGTEDLATIFSDNGVTPKSNPFLTAGDGSYFFYAANGRYAVHVARAGFTFDNTVTDDILLYDPADNGGGGGGGGGGPVASFLTGEMRPFAGAAVPDGWLQCDGAAVSRETYAALFAVIGTTYGAGDGATTFNLPDTRGRVLVGIGAGAGLTARALGAVGGAETHALTPAEMPPHTHGLGGHTHPVGPHKHEVPVTPWNFGGSHERVKQIHTDWPHGLSGQIASFRSLRLDAIEGIEAHPTLMSGPASGTTGAAAGATGGADGVGNGTAHPHMPPFLAVNVIIKT